jgi:hypothetical protein
MAYNSGRNKSMNLTDNKKVLSKLLVLNFCKYNIFAQNMYNIESFSLLFV